MVLAAPFLTLAYAFRNSQEYHNSNDGLIQNMASKICLTVEKKQNLKLSSAANYRWRFNG